MLREKIGGGTGVEGHWVLGAGAAGLELVLYRGVLEYRIFGNKIFLKIYKRGGGQQHCHAGQAT